MSVNQDKIVEPLEQLIKSCVKGHRHAQSKLYGLFASKMFVVCLRYCKSREEAEEVLQEGFVKVFQFMHQYNATGPFEGWMRKIMVNCALQKYRSRTHLYAVVNIDAIAADPTDNDEIIAQLGTKELLEMVQQLPPAYRMVFNLYVFEGLKHREIAELLGISEGTSKSNLSDARAILQKAVTRSLQVAKKNINCL